MVDFRLLRKNGLTLVLASGLATAALLESALAVIIWQNDFEDDPVGTYTVTNLRADWNGPSWNNGVGEGRVSITDDAKAYGDKSLVVTYPEGQTTGGKSQWRLNLGGSYEELFASYRLRFDDGFDFVRGGKLPGLCGGACNTGGDDPNGFDGWSARMMWRTKPSGGSQLPSHRANIVQYLYHPDQPTRFGEDLKWNDTTPPDWKIFDSDVWYQVQHRIVMNTPGQHNGIVQAWLDGEMVLDRQDIRFRDVSSFGIDTFYFSTFFGGSSSIWEASKDERAYFDDFVISTEFIPNPGRGDFDGDGDIDSADLSIWQSAYASTEAGDADGDLDTDGFDFLVWQRRFTGELSAPPQTTVVPEPTSVVLLLGLAALGILSRPGRPFPHRFLDWRTSC